MGLKDEDLQMKRWRILWKERGLYITKGKFKHEITV